MCTHPHTFTYTLTVVRERKRRQAVEKRLKDIEGLAKHQLKQYDNTLIEIAKQVSELWLSLSRPLKERKPVPEVRVFTATSCIWLHSPTQLTCSHTGFNNIPYSLYPGISTARRGQPGP